jgi:archaellum component FlaC
LAAALNDSRTAQSEQQRLRVELESINRDLEKFRTGESTQSKEKLEELSRLKKRYSDLESVLAGLAKVR